MIVAENLTKKYGDFTAVDSISFEVPKGESFGLLGPNGAGKSTTMRMIGGTLERTSGRLEVLGLDPEAQGPEVRAHLGVTLAPDSAAYARFLTHVKFAVRRIEDEQLLVGTDSTLFDMVREKDPRAYECALAIASYVGQRYEVELPEEELLYLMVHINRLRHRDVPAQ